MDFLELLFYFSVRAYEHQQQPVLGLCDQLSLWPDVWQQLVTKLRPRPRPAVAWLQSTNDMGNLQGNMVVSINGGTPKWMVCFILFHGKSHLEMDDLGVALF